MTNSVSHERPYFSFSGKLNFVIYLFIQVGLCESLIYDTLKLQIKQYVSFLSMKPNLYETDI